jgi:hypothetical protein
MKPKVKKSFQLNGVFYDQGEEINVDSKEQLIKLNELGFIEPLTQKEIQDYFRLKEDERRWD